MKRKKPTPDEWRAWREARETRVRELRARAERIRLELEERRPKRGHA